MGRLFIALFVFCEKDGSERIIESLSLIDSVMPEVIETRKKAVAEKLKDATNLNRGGLTVASTNSHTTNGDCNTPSATGVIGLPSIGAACNDGGGDGAVRVLPNHHGHAEHMAMEVEENAGGSVAPTSAPTSAAVEVAANKITVLRGHESEVFICAWNPKNDLLASGSGDSTARIWNAADPHVAQNPKNQLVLKHCISRGGQEVPSNKDVTSLDWNVSSQT